MNSKKNFMFATIAFLALAVFAGFANATITEFISADSTQSVEHNSQATIQINIKSDVVVSSVALTLPNLFGSTVWGGDTGSFALPANISVSRTVTLTVPEGQSPGIYTGDIELSGETIHLNITVLEDKSIQVTIKQEMTQTNNGIITVENIGNVVLNNVEVSKVSGDFNVEFNPDTLFNLAVDGAGSKKDIAVNSTDLGKVGFGGKSVVLKAESVGVSDSVTMTVEGSFCRSGEGSSLGYLEISDLKIDNYGSGKDDSWKLLDEVEVAVKVSFDGLDNNDDAQDVTVVLGLYDSDGKDQIGDLYFEDSDEEEKNLGDLDDGDKEEVTFRFKVPADFTDGSYKLTVKAYSDDVSVEGVGEGFDECIDTSRDHDGGNGRYSSIKVDRENDEGRYIAFDDFEISPSDATCNERVSLSFNVFNIGDKDQDQVKIVLKNSQLGVDETFEIRNNFGQGDKERVSFDFLVPTGIGDGNYQLEILSEYDYRRGIYRQKSDKSTPYTLKVLGCGSVSGGSGTGARIAAISASLDSDVTSGEELVVRVTITNLADTDKVFVIDVGDYSGWASLKSVSEKILNIDAGKSKETTMKFMIESDATGEESFVVDVIADGVTESKEIFVDIGGSTSNPTEGLFNLDFGGDNAYLWIIGIINVVLVILIIVVAVRIARK